MTVKLYPHQKQAVDKLDNGKILWGGVGTGKSLTAIAYYMKREAPRDIFVITTAKKRDSLDWEREAVKYGIGKQKDATTQGVLTVDSWNNIGKYTDCTDAFFIFDEQRLVGSGAWSKAFIKIAKQNRWILLTATPGDTWLDYIPVFVANGFYKNRTEFKRNHVVYSSYTKFPKVERYLETGKLVRLRNSLLVHMPYQRHTVRHNHILDVEFDRESFDKVVKKRWNIFTERPIRDIAELFITMRKVVNSDPSRLLEVRKLIQKHPKVIIFYNFDYELEILRELAEEEPWQTSAISSAATSRTPTPARSSRSAQRSPESCTTSSSTELSDRTTFGKSPTSKFPSSSRDLGTKSSTKTRSNSISGRRTSDLCEPKTTASTCSGSTSSSMPKTGFEANSESDRKKKTFAVAEWNGHKHEPIPDTDRWVYLVQYTAGSEGWNCVETNVVIFWSLTYSYKQWHQAFGRIDRLNTPFTNLHYYILMSNSLIDKAVMRSLKDKKSFNESSLSIF